MRLSVLVACLASTSCVAFGGSLDDVLEPERPALAGEIVEGRYFGPGGAWSVTLPHPPLLAAYGSIDEYDAWAVPITVEVPAEAPIQAVRFAPVTRFTFETEFFVEVAWLPRAGGPTSDFASFEAAAVSGFEQAAARQPGGPAQLLVHAPLELPGGRGSRWIYQLHREGWILPYLPRERSFFVIRDLVEFEQGFAACMGVVNLVDLAGLESREDLDELLPTALARYGPTLDAVTASFRVHPQPAGPTD
ncbi:hypothetical protein [Engelhardtia mirabilis]|uniref:Uncharacterized protein n=1 Tax=Engelhardtia mirabilis TaxID=2528011 RepID=A0A518BIH1_9BACT|nr:hypothetical protein Pla133_18550 [Planctomycetes bacterium Pla133]QDV01105.1 hypothetical protein Pla86_18540 [Planctomycetes bacterium Pla86]